MKIHKIIITNLLIFLSLSGNCQEIRDALLNAKDSVQKSDAEMKWVMSLENKNLTQYLPDSLKKSKSIIILTYTSDGCYPCRINDIVLDSIKKIYPEVKQLTFMSHKIKRKKNIDSNNFIGVLPNLKEELKAFATPTSFIIENGKVKQIKLGGPSDIQQAAKHFVLYEDKIEKVLESFPIINTIAE